MADFTLTATMRSRHNFAIPHLMGAARFARQLAQVESDHADEPFGDFHTEVQALATAAVMMAVAAAESFLNERFADAKKLLSPEMLTVWSEAAKDIDKKGVADKADWFLILRGKAPLDRSGQLHQNISALVQLRNGLVHFKPEWVDEADRHTRISAQLAGRFSPLKWLASDPGLFPRAWASHSCAEWAVSTSLLFMETVSAAAGLDFDVEKFRARLATR